MLMAAHVLVNINLVTSNDKCQQILVLSWLLVITVLRDGE